MASEIKQQRDYLPKLKDHTCFACGDANPIGLNLHFYRWGNYICTDLILSPHFVGWENMVHGGIISALLDETMAWAVIFFKRSFFVTRKIEIHYIRPVLTGVPLHVRAGLQPQKRSRFLKGSAELRDIQDRLLAKGAAEFALLSKERMTLVSEDKKHEMQELFEKLPPLSN